MGVQSSQPCCLLPVKVTDVLLDQIDMPIRWGRFHGNGPTRPWARRLKGRGHLKGVHRWGRERMARWKRLTERLPG
eukprot:3049396-Alexandrium_andersonii.AAC.1